MTAAEHRFYAITSEPHLRSGYLAGTRWPYAQCLCGAKVVIPGYDPDTGPWPTESDALEAMRTHAALVIATALEAIAEAVQR